MSTFDTEETHKLRIQIDLDDAERFAVRKPYTQSKVVAANRIVAVATHPLQTWQSNVGVTVHGHLRLKSGDLGSRDSAGCDVDLLPEPYRSQITEAVAEWRASL